jgi:hypothetical protein
LPRRRPLLKICRWNGKETPQAQQVGFCSRILDRWKMIHRADACRDKALKCERAALVATDPKAQAAYRDMARQWREIATQAEVLDQRQAVRGKALRRASES